MTNDVWFWGYNKGVAKFDGVSFELWYVDNSAMPTNEVTDVDIEVGSTTAWVSTTNGIVKIENDEFEIFDTTNTILAVNNIFGGVIGQDGCKYFGTNEGLYTLKDELWNRIDSLNSDVPIFSQIIPLGVDSYGGVWFQGEDLSKDINICRYFNDQWQAWNHNNSEFGTSLSYQFASSNGFVYIISERKVYVLDISSDVDSRELNNFRMYPNPSTGNVFLKSINLISSVNVFGVGGELVETIRRVNSERVKLDVSKLNSGIYSVNVIFENGEIITKKLIVN